MGSGKKKTSTASTQTYKPPSYIEDRAQQAADLAGGYAGQTYTPYNKERVAGLGENEQLAADLAREGVGSYEGDLGQARGALESVTDFTGADMDAYMNPYIKGAIDPTAREIREEGARRRNEKSGQLSTAGAFGSRAALALREEDELTQQGISDVYGRGYSEAFDRGAGLWQADQDRKLQQASGFMNLAGMGSDLADKDFQRLSESGETQRYVDQMMKDFDYQQFTEDRDWGGKQAAYLTDVLRGLKGSYGETTESTASTEEKTSGNVLGQILGAATTIAGAYFSGGATLALAPGAKAGTDILSQTE